MNIETMKSAEAVLENEIVNADQEAAFRMLQDCELMLIGGGGADVVFG
jgi:hypothetical protein